MGQGQSSSGTSGNLQGSTLSNPASGSFNYSTIEQPKDFVSGGGGTTGPNFPSFYPVLRHDFSDLHPSLAGPANVVYTLWKWVAILVLVNCAASIFALFVGRPAICYNCYEAPWTTSVYYNHLILSIVYVFIGQLFSFVVWYWPTFAALRHGGSQGVCVAMVTVGVAITMSVVVFLGNIRYGLAGIIFTMDVYHTSREAVGPLILPIINTGLWLIQAGMLSLVLWKLWVFHRSEYTDNVSHRAAGATGAFSILFLVVFLIFFYFPFQQPPWPGRHFCFRNSCGRSIRIGQIGGATGIACAVGCPVGTVCNDGNGLCHFSLPFPPALDIAAHDTYCLDLDYPAVTANIFPRGGSVVHSLTQWSGAFYASTDCVGTRCGTAICDDCSPYVGPVGPVTQAEMTLLAEDQDYYDITIINGVNVPLSITPQGGSFRPSTKVAPDYYCKSPGASSGNTWAFDAGARAATVRLVGGGSGAPCPCANGEVCGTAMILLPNGLPTPQVASNVCGQLRGYWSDDELCAWTDASTFGDCKAPVPNNDPWGGTFEQMFQCTGAYAGSCFQVGAGPGCCGCTVWGAANAAVQCQAVNNAWVANAQPRLAFLKAACPSCYTYPYDDSTSLFACQGSGASVNLNSYTLEWCPGGVQLT